MPPKISVIVPAYNAGKTIGKTLRSLKGQTFRDFETIVVDDSSSDGTRSVALKHTKNVISNERNMGPAFTRNAGIKRSKAKILAFIDADAVARKDWLARIYEKIHGLGFRVIMGRVTIPKAGYVGDSISALGFPAGGSAGFERIWRVGKDGSTNHISSCNFAAQRSVFSRHGMFDETFPLAGGEDAEFSARLERRGVKVMYCPDVVVEHAPRKSIRSFMGWQMKRGRSNYHFKQKVGDVAGFFRLRLWSTKNIIRDNLLDAKLPAIMLLLFLSFMLQGIGYLHESVVRGKGKEEAPGAGKRRSVMNRKNAILALFILLAVLAGAHRYYSGKAWMIDGYWDTAEVFRAFALGQPVGSLRGLGTNIANFTYQQNEPFNDVISFAEPDAELEVFMWRYNMTRFVYPLTSAMLGIVMFWADMRFVCMLLNVLVFIASVIVMSRICREMGMSDNEAVIASIFFITSTTSLSLIVSAMASPLASLLVMLSLYCLLRLSKEDDDRYLMLYMLFATLAIMSREMLILVSFVPLLANTRLGWKKRVLAAVVPGLVFIIYLYASQLIIPEFMHRIYGVKPYAEAMGPKARAPHIFAVSTALAFGLAGIFALFGIKRKYLRNPVLLWAIIFMMFFLLNPNVYFAQKHFFPMVFSVSIFGALGVTDISRRVKRLSPAILVALALIVNFLLLMFRIIVFQYH